VVARRAAARTILIVHGRVFTARAGGSTPDELPLFRADGYPVFQLTTAESARATAIFSQLHEELASDYAHKYDLLRAYVLELLHLGQKRQPATTLHPAHSAAARLSSRFVELLERQFPLTTAQRRVPLRTAKDFADQLAVHVNHLNSTKYSRTARVVPPPTSSAGDWCRKRRCCCNNRTGRSGKLPTAWALSMSPTSSAATPP
jgi:hypothetical protein